MAKRSTPTEKPASEATNEPGEEFDTAIFAQGKRAKEGGVPDENPFAEGTPQAESWAAGYAAGEAPEAPPEQAEE